MNENWTDDLRHQMEQYESTEVPEGLWEGIEQELDQSPRAVVVPMWRRLAAACIAIGVIVTGGILFFMNQSDEKQLANDILKCENTPPDAIDNKAYTEADDVDMLTEQYSHAQPRHTGIITDENLKNTETDAIASETASPESTDDKTVEAPTPDVGKEDKPAVTLNPYHETVVPVNRTTHRNNQHGNLKVALYASQMSDNHSPDMEGYLALSPQSIPDNNPPMLSKVSMGNWDYLAIANDGKNPVTSAHHHQPVRIGFNVGYDLNRRWGVNIGVTYTKLNSTLTAGTESSYYTNDQTINYVGVPVGISYNLLRNRHLRLYATVGGTIELGAGGETIVETITKNRHVATEKHEIDDVPAQLSATIGGGAELKVYRMLGIFAEAGAAYFFDNNSKYATIYSIHPLNLNLQFGIRWTINPKE